MLKDHDIRLMYFRHDVSDVLSKTVPLYSFFNSDSIDMPVFCFYIIFKCLVFLKCLMRNDSTLKFTCFFLSDFSSIAYDVDGN